MKTTLTSLLSVALLAAPLGLVAQTTTGENRPARYAAGDAAEYGPRMGDREMTIGGSGLTNKDLDNSSGGVNASFGWYLSDTTEVVVRQTVNYVNSDVGSSSWAGSTRLALDQHLMARGALRPFVGVNFGGVYGDDTNETWIAGIEGGAKFYLQPRTFVFALLDYGWSFDDGDDADDTFSDGGFTWSLGLGFNF